ncbi:GAF modulated sigma54 specific transcriptional regulator, Fis family [Shewanella denitrificans OS217]|uniref:GAF modulated sigma54 specific transcriptional regulator, Fis family n=1 Tax=Shewanella denitrificans (strain OS217 / ATCC BAA-1090 / DSM 15013) TaxID=318161 RepID=Q12LQ8_SHEDO|nr:sigma-54-dependent Fis family transcriptional regulator [Shewanella denitrificans]ABE55618.1 GAF modulated sigma54 specific transcriptional regulator, Fis family [Shewanella denitrificans OS217]
MTAKTPSLLQGSSHWLTDSWQRSSLAGLEQTHLPEYHKLDPVSLQQKQADHSVLIRLVETQALPLFYQVMAHSQSRLILSASDGYVLKHWGLSKYSDKLANIALDEGVSWLEENQGTNAIGTALKARQLVSVIGEQHFFAKHRFMSCTASPIFSPSGELIAALDITSEQQVHSQQTLLLISSLAQLIETALLCQLPDSHYRVDLATQPHLFGSLWQGIAVADSQGKLLGFNPMAKHLLQSMQVGDSLTQHIGDRWQRERHSQHKMLHLKTQQVEKQPLKKSAPSQTANKLGLKFKDPQLEQAWQQANKVLTRQIPLLICGETGVGKEHFVKQLHSQSDRHAKPLVAINCAAIPHDLVEAELFGYQAGAYTGANKQGFMGKIRQAHEGFLFLDEIGDMPLMVQTRLLRVLQEREVVPIGSNKAIPVDIQLVAASHGDLLSKVASGEFRQDLFYRLNGLQIRLPALRDRQDKLRIIEKLHGKYRLGEQGMCPQLLGLLLAYSWPGNLRELDNMMQVACLMAEGERQLTFDKLPSQIQVQLQTCATAVKQHGFSPVIETSHTELKPKCRQNLAQQVEAEIMAAFLDADSNVSQCAKNLGISRNSLYRKLRKLGVR